jgi:hypothetical protein
MPKAPEEVGGWLNSFLPKNWQSEESHATDEWNSQVRLALGVTGERAAKSVEALQLRAGMSPQQKEQVKAAAEAAIKAKLSQKNRGSSAGEAD